VSSTREKQAMKDLNRLPLFLLVLSVIGLSPVVLSGEDGIAKKYLRDVGIENDPNVVFAERFETGTLTDIVNRWTDRKNVQGMSLVADGPTGTSGLRALLITSVGGTNSGGHLYNRLPAGYDQLYFRYYIKYASVGTYHHTGGYLGGYNPPTNWPQGGAGIRPSGNDRFSSVAEPVTSDGRFDFYTYWMHMRGASDGFWGNDFIQDPNLKITRDQWMCVEIMIKLNNPVSSFNGEMALWVNGQKVSHLGPGFPKGRWNVDSFFPDPTGTPFEGFQWRNDPALTLNWINLQHYVTQDPAGFVGKISVDHVVLAKAYIGPLNTSPVDVDPPAPPTNLRVSGSDVP
jgi:hypothetical protein